MKRKALSVLLTFTMVAALLAGCGSKTPDTAEADTKAETTAADAETTESEAATDEAAGEEAAESGDKPLAGVELKMAINAEYAPFESKNESGEIEGFDVDLNAALADILGYTYTFDDMDFTGLISAIQSGRDDYCISALSGNEERKKVVDFSEGYYTPVTAILVPAGSDIQGVEDLAGKKIGVTLGTEFEAFANTIDGATVISYENIPSSIKLIGTSELDCAIMDSSNAFAYTDASEGTLEYRVVKISEVEGVLDNPYCMVFPKGSEYVELFNDALQTLRDNGTMEELQTKWFGQEYTDALNEAE